MREYARILMDASYVLEDDYKDGAEVIEWISRLDEDERSGVRVVCEFILQQLDHLEE